MESPQAVPSSSLQRFLVPGILVGVFVVMAVAGVIFFTQSSTSQTDLKISAQDEKKFISEERDEVFFQEAKDSAELQEEVQGLQLKAGISKSADAGKNPDLGFDVGVQATGVIPDGKIPVVWTQMDGVWLATTLTSADDNQAVSFTRFSLPADLSRVTSLVLRLETSGFKDDQPEVGELLWDISSLLQSGSTL
jgi:hypothetical protein